MAAKFDRAAAIPTLSTADDNTLSNMLRTAMQYFSPARAPRRIGEHFVDSAPAPRLHEAEYSPFLVQFRPSRIKRVDDLLSRFNLRA
jgi:hypothetical protein